MLRKPRDVHVKRIAALQPEDRESNIEIDMDIDMYMYMYIYICVCIYLFIYAPQTTQCPCQAHRCAPA